MATKTSIHPTAIIENGAQIAEGVQIGPYAYVGAQVKLGSGTVVHHHATVDGVTTLGENNQIFPYAFVGGMTHDLKYSGGKPGLVIGNQNVFREYSTVHGATKDGEFTRMGDHNVILAYSHIAHDCIVGNHLVMSSHAALGGHVIVEDHVTVGWSVGVHQFCRIGAYVMVGAMSKIVQDVLPLMIVDGNPATVRSFNKVGLERAGYVAKDLQVAKWIYKLFYREHSNRSDSLAKMQEIAEKSPHVFFEWTQKFIQASQRGLI
jgi:UDP-N-acetylglucosamine acyltransferase